MARVNDDPIGSAFVATTRDGDSTSGMQFDDFMIEFIEVPTHVPEATFVALDHGRPVGYAKVTPRPGVPGAAY